MIAAGIIGGMNNELGIANWRWLFIIEGAITMFFGFVTVVVLPDFPHNSRGFSIEERKLAVLRMTEDAGQSDSDNTGTWGAFVGAMTDYRTHVMALTLTSLVVSLTFNQFFPTITRTIFPDRIQSLLLAAPPFALAAIVAFLNARHSDKTGERYFHIVIPILVMIVGFIIAIATSNTAARYVSLFLMACGYAGFVVFYAWISGTFPRPPMRRGIAIAYINAFSQLGNIAGSYVYPSRWGPSYHYSFGLSIAVAGAAIIGLTFHRWDLARLNKKLDALEHQRAADGDVKRTEKLPYALDVVPGFRYML